MTLDEFQALIDRLGADLTRWPEAIAASARRLVEDDPEAASLLERERSWEAALVPEAIPAAPSAERIVARTLARRPRRPWGGLEIILARPELVSGAVFATCLMIGIVLGAAESWHGSDELDLVDGHIVEAPYD